MACNSQRDWWSFYYTIRDNQGICNFNKDRYSLGSVPNVLSASKIQFTQQFVTFVWGLSVPYLLWHRRNIQFLSQTAKHPRIPSHRQSKLPTAFCGVPL